MGRHASHQIHENSAASLAQCDLSDRDAMVLAVYFRCGPALTDREVATHLGFADMNAVRPSITGLRDRGHLKEIASVRDAKTNRTVRLCAPPSFNRKES